MKRRHILTALCILAFPSCLPGAERESSHWSYQPLSDARPPVAGNSAWVRNPIDAFVLAKLDEHELTPQAEADRHTLIRRVTAGLTGFPPTVEELEGFLSDSSPQAYEKLVDTLLSSPHYGERWARHWLDVARFGESDGILTVNEDKIRKNAWRYRDAVIRAFNADLPFDLFVRYQLSGVPKEDPGMEDYKELNQFIHLGTRLQNNADPNDKQFHRLDDMVSTTGNAFLAVTFGCARCHDHPVDPMTTEEYDQFTSIFFDQVREEPKASKKKIALKITEPRVLKNGSWATPGDKVGPGFLRVLMNKPSSHWLGKGQSNLGSLAGWMTDIENGAGMQLARVVVNRLWHYHFGRGLVSTPNDFGVLGSKPSHPELLDWLASRLIENGWKLKPLHRLILTSAVYRQGGASGNPRALEVDAENQWLWQFRPRKLEAEAIRDRLLRVAGVLRTDLYGPSISIGGYKKTVEDTSPSWRRSIYLQLHRTVRHPTLSLFDPADSQRSVGVRNSSTSPEGALFALNSPLTWDLAEQFAKRVVSVAGPDPSMQVKHAYLIALTRRPTAEERELGLELLRKENARALIDYCHLILGLNEFIYIH